MEKTVFKAWVVALLLALGLAAMAHAENRRSTTKAPTPPPAEVPDMRLTKPPILCVDCDEPFSPGEHDKLLVGLLDNPYNSELRKALYFQDTIHQFESKAHFDNCDFQSAMQYLTLLLEETGKHVQAAAGTNPSDRAAIEKSTRSAFFALGQALHGVQDFYAHSNYVEMQVPKVKKVTEIDILAPWRKEGQDQIEKLRTQGLASGFVFWGFPQKCPAKSISHGDLAKDTANTKSGKRLAAHLENLSYYRIAAFLARESSLALMRDSFKRWPILKEINGPNVAFEVLVDRRGL